MIAYRVDKIEETSDLFLSETLCYKFTKEAAIKFIENDAGNVPLKWGKADEKVSNDHKIDYAASIQYEWLIIPFEIED